MMMPRLTLITTLLSTALAQDTFWKESFKLDFSYDANSKQGDGPNKWGNVNVANSEWRQYAVGHELFDLNIGSNECTNRIRPSPIPLRKTGRCSDEHELFTRQINDSDCTRNDITFELTPHTLRAYFPENDDTCERPTIEMDGNTGDPFVLTWMEVHARSEHVVDGRRYDAELQMVHMGTSNSDDEMAIVSILIDASAREDHTEFQYLLDQWQSVASDQTAKCGETTRSLRIRDEVVPNQESRRAQQQQQCTGKDCGPRRKMYPYSMWPSVWYFRYSGSLTTPPCSAIVNWRIVDKEMLISRRQYKQLTTLLTANKDGDCQDDTVLSATGENFRPLQNVNNNNQNVEHCTKADFGVLQYAADEQ